MPYPSPQCRHAIWSSKRAGAWHVASREDRPTVQSKEDPSSLTREVLDLKLRLATAMAQIDAERHDNRLLLDQIDALQAENEELQDNLEQAHYCLVKHACNGAETNRPQIPEENQWENSTTNSWLRRASSNISLDIQSLAHARSSTSSGSSSSASSISRRPCWA